MTTEIKVGSMFYTVTQEFADGINAMLQGYLQEHKINELIEKEKEKEIFKDGIWTAEQENKIKDIKMFIEGMNEHLSKSFLYSKRKIFKKEIYDAEIRLNSLISQKNYFIGKTAESFANDKARYYQILSSFYKDEGLKNKLIDLIPEEELYIELKELYEKSMQKINGKTIKKISLSPFFYSMYSMCGDNAYYFYGKPISNLTNFQIDLMSYGRYFKDMLSKYGSKIPDEMNEDPDDIMEWLSINQNVESSGILKEDDGQNISSTSITGATKEDLKLMGINPAQIVNMSKEISKHGGIIDKDAMYKMNA